MRRAFTLIELLIVIAIIGILAGIIIVSVNAARQKAKDARIKTSLGETQVFAEKYYSKHQAYICIDRTGGESPCDDFIKYPLTENLWLTKIKDEIIANGGEPYLPTWGPSYAAGAKLNDGTYWCVDSQGFEGQVTAARWYENEITREVRCVSP